MNSWLSVSFFLLLSLSAATAKPFTCNSAPTATCRGLVEYIPANSTTLASVQSLFQVPNLSSLLTVNNLPASTRATLPVAANSTVVVPFPCRCSNDRGISDNTPIYTVKPSDPGLDYIARTVFDLLVTYQDIAEVNKIQNVSVITKGEKLWIPLPCSCDPVDGKKVEHLAHIVARGSSVAQIAKDFGTTEAVLLQLNGIADPKLLQAGQILDVPFMKAGSNSLAPAPQPASGNLPPGVASPPAGNSVGSLRPPLGLPIEFLVMVLIAWSSFMF